MVSNIYMAKSHPYVLEFFRDAAEGAEKGLWFWRYIWRRGEQKLEICRSSKGYARKTDCSNSFQSARNGRFSQVEIL